MFYKKNINYVYLFWEDFLFQIKNKDAKKTNKMSYPRFTKIIIDYFMSKDKSISSRNKMFWHTTRDDTMFTFMICISRHKDTQVYGTIFLKELTNQAMLESNAYKTYYIFPSREKTPKLKYVQKKANPDTSPKQKLVQATKGTRLKSKAKVAKPDKKKQPAKKTKAKGLTILSEQQKSSGTDERTGTIPGVLDVPIYESKSEKESWGDSEDEDNENDSDYLSDEGDDINDGDDDDDANDDDKQEGDDTIDDDKETDSDRTESDIIKIPIFDQSTTEYYEEEEQKIDDEKPMDEEEEDNKVTKELYDNLNVNSGNKDTKKTNADQGASEQQNVSQDSGFEQVEEDTHLLNLENPSPADNKIASLMETLARHATAIPENTSGFTTTIPPPPSVTNLEKYLSEIKQEAQDEKNAYTELVDTSIRALIKKEKNITKLVEVAVLTRSSLQPTSTYKATASLSEFELTMILIDKMEKNKSYDKADYKKKLYDALVESYNTDKDLFDLYGEVFSLKRNSRSKDKKSSITSKDASQSQHKSSGKSAHAEEPIHTVEDSGMQQDQEFITGDNDE
ncbi:hypothetical protein Tco_0973937 [Tanacetum coccineum]|uniref:Uncharacterized protein n=1 Tax=Tanacetum coccineum TaxID=301880 RepID=A0ABQ5EA85_9ASTR